LGLASRHGGAGVERAFDHAFDIGDRALVARIAREHQIESCIHFAALAYVGESVTDPAKYFENNAANGIAFIGALVQAGVLRLVFSSTCATYGEPEEMPISEQCRQWPKNPYGWTKLLIERLLDAYDTAYHLKFVALRYFNAAGATEKFGEDHRLDVLRGHRRHHLHVGPGGEDLRPAPDHHRADVLAHGGLLRGLAKLPREHVVDRVHGRPVEPDRGDAVFDLEANELSHGNPPFGPAQRTPSRCG